MKPLLIDEVRACRICADFLPFPPRPILQFSPRARILIAGQAPGRAAHNAGIAFDDPSGERLRSWMGVTRAQFYDPDLFAILPMGFCYPGSGPSGDLPPRPECAPAWREKLLSQLTQLELTLVIGRYAQAYHFPEKRGTLTALVSSWRDHWPNTLPLPHPSPRNRLWFKHNPWFEAELIPALQARVTEILTAPSS